MMTKTKYNVRRYNDAAFVCEVELNEEAFAYYLAEADEQGIIRFDRLVEFVEGFDPWDHVAADDDAAVYLD